MAIHAATLDVKVIANTSAAEKGVMGFSDKFNNAAKTMRNVGVGLTAAITAPLVGIAAAGLNLAMGFEQNMNILQQATGATAAEMSMLQELALSLGATTVFSAGDAALAMVELGKAGFNTVQIMGSIDAVMALAAAGGVAVANAATLMATSLQAFNLEVSESGRVADVFAAAANASAMGVEDMGMAVANAGFAFKMADFSIEDLAASMVILTNSGLGASDASTALKNAVMRMFNPTQEAVDMMNQLGISFYDALGNMKTMPAILDNINEATAGLTNEQRDAALSTIFMSDGMKAMMPLLNAQSTGYNEVVASVSQFGAAHDAAAARMKGLSGGIEYLKGSVESFLIGAALPFLDTLNKWAIGIGDAITAFGALPQPIINASLAIAGVAAAAGPLLIVLSALAPAFSLLAGPIGIVIAATAALAAAWVSDFMGIQGATASAVSAIQAQLTMLGTAAKTFGTSVSAAFNKTKFPTLDELWTDFKAGDFDSLATKIRDTAFNLMVNLDAELNITGKATQLKDQLVGAVNSFSTAVATLDFSGAKANLDTMRDGILGQLTTAISGMDFGKGGSVFAGLVDKLTAAIEGLDFSTINWATVFQGALVGPAVAAVNGLNWLFGSESFAGLVTAVKGAIGTIPWGELGTSFAGLGTAILAELGALAADIIGDLATLFGKPPKPVEMAYPKITVKTQAEALIAPYPTFKPGLQGAPIPLPYPSMKLEPPPPSLSIKPKMPEKEMDNFWKFYGDFMIAGIGTVTTEIENVDWTTVGSNVASALKTAVGIAVTGIGTAFVLVSSAQTLVTQTLEKGITGAFTNISWGGVTIAVKDALGVVGTAISDYFTGFAAELTGMRATNLAEATSVSDILRDQQLGIKGFEWPDLPPWEWPGYLAWTWADYVPWEWPEITIPGWVTTLLDWTPAWVATLMSWNPLAGGTGGIGAEFESPAFASKGVFYDTLIGSAKGGGKGRQSMRPPAPGEATATAQLPLAQVPLNWDTYVTPLAWATYVTPLDWLSYVPPMVWDNFMAQLDWNSFISSLDWESFVPALSWNSFVTSLDWGSFVERINWGSFITDISWDNYVPDMNWGNYVDHLDWGKYIPAFAAPAGDVVAGISSVRRGGDEVAGISSVGGGGAVVQFTGPITIGSDMDIEQLTVQIARRLNQKMR